MVTRNLCKISELIILFAPKTTLTYSAQNENSNHNYISYDVCLPLCLLSYFQVQISGKITTCPWPLELRSTGQNGLIFFLQKCMLEETSFSVGDILRSDSAEWNVTMEISLRINIAEAWTGACASDTR